MRSALRLRRVWFLTETFYWDMNAGTRAWTKALAGRAAGKNPEHEPSPASMRQFMHYLKAVAALKSAADGKAVVAKMKETGRPTIRCSARVWSASMAARSTRPISSR